MEMGLKILSFLITIAITFIIWKSSSAWEEERPSKKMNKKIWLLIGIDIILFVLIILI